MFDSNEISSAGINTLKVQKCKYNEQLPVVFLYTSRMLDSNEIARKGTNTLKFESGSYNCCIEQLSAPFLYALWMLD